MSTTTLVLLIVLAIGIIAVLFYNRLVSLRNRTRNGFSQIEVQLQRRYELIPNLIEIASTYMKHERETLVAVTNARNTASERCKEVSKGPADSKGLGALASADGALSSALGQMNLVMENYPELKADQQMIALTEELATTENRVAFARQAYSDAVMFYNTAREQFPAVVVANTCSFNEASLFEADNPAVREPIKVSFA